MSTPGVSRGTSTIDCCAYLGAFGSVLPMKIKILQRGSPAPDDHHLRPLIKYMPPSRTIELWILVASDDATARSAIVNAERIRPSINASNHCFFCSGVP